MHTDVQYTHYNLYYFTGIRQAGHTITTDRFFDTVTIKPKDGVDALRQRAEAMEINVRLRDETHVGRTKFTYLYSLF